MAALFLNYTVVASYDNLSYENLNSYEIRI